MFFLRTTFSLFLREARSRKLPAVMKKAFRKAPESLYCTVFYSAVYGINAT